MGKGKTPKEILKRREEGRRKKNTESKPSKRTTLDWKTWAGLVIGAIGLLIAVIGLVALRPHPTVSADEPLNPADVTTSQFVISNDGLLALNDVRIFPYIRGVATLDQSNFYDEGGNEYFVPTKTLEPGDKQTVPFGRLFALADDRITSADIGVIIYFRSEYLPLWQQERAFRFVTAAQSNGRLRFVPEPAGDTLERFNKVRKDVGPKDD